VVAHMWVELQGKAKVFDAGMQWNRTFSFDGMAA